MKKYIFIGFLIFALILSINLYAQDRWPSLHKGTSLMNKNCTPLPDLDITDEQQNIITEKKRFYREQTMIDRVLLLAKRLELERMLNDPEVGKEELRSKAEEIGQLTGRMETVRYDLLIDIRQVLTPPQIETWCPSIGRPFEKGKTRRP